LKNRESGEPESGLNKTFRRLLATAAGMPLAAIIGGTIAFYFSRSAGYMIVLLAVAAGMACLAACLLLRLTGRHSSKEK
jgi:zinc transporter ZupT